MMVRGVVVVVEMEIMVRERMREVRGAACRARSDGCGARLLVGSRHGRARCDGSRGSRGRLRRGDGRGRRCKARGAAHAARRSHRCAGRTHLLRHVAIRQDGQLLCLLLLLGYRCRGRRRMLRRSSFGCRRLLGGSIQAGLRGLDRSSGWRGRDRGRLCRLGWRLVRALLIRCRRSFARARARAGRTIRGRSRGSGSTSSCRSSGSGARLGRCLLLGLRFLLLLLLPLGLFLRQLPYPRALLLLHLHLLTAHRPDVLHRRTGRRRRCRCRCALRGCRSCAVRGLALAQWCAQLLLLCRSRLGRSRFGRCGLLGCRLRGYRWGGWCRDWRGSCGWCRRRSCGCGCGCGC